MFDILCFIVKVFQIYHYNVKLNIQFLPNTIIGYNVHFHIFNEYYLVKKFEYMILYVLPFQICSLFPLIIIECLIILSNDSIISFVKHCNFWRNYHNLFNANVASIMTTSCVYHDLLYSYSLMLILYFSEADQIYQTTKQLK